MISPNASESIPDGLRATPIDLDTCLLAKKTIPDGSDNGVLLDTWWSLPEEYTKRRLTYPEKDNLVALSAIARDVGEAMNDVYIAGHFWNTIPLCLNWSLEGLTNSRLCRYGRRAQRVFWSEKPHAQDNGPRAPSWSWASLDGPVFFGKVEGRSDRQLVEAVSYTLELANKANPTGCCISASISIRAYCTELEWQSQNEPVMVTRTEAWICDNTLLHVDLDEPEVIREKGTKSLMVVLSGGDFLEWEGIVVEEIPHQERTTYRRVGHFTMMGQRIESLTWWDERFSIFGREKKLVELV